MRIVIDGRYINDAFPGIGRYTYNLIVALAATAGDDTLLVLTNSRLRNRRYDISRLAAPPACQLVECPIDRFLPSELLYLAPAVRKLHPDLFHSPFFLRPYPLGCPCVQTIYDLQPIQAMDEHSRTDYILFRLGMHFAVRNAAAVLTISEQSAREIRLHWPNSGDRIFVTPLAADKKFHPLPIQESQQNLHRLGLDGCRYVFHISSGLKHKNVGLLLRAWNDCLKDSCLMNWKLVLAGNFGQRREGYAALARQLAIEGSVSFLGDIDEEALVALYNRAELFVFPSSMEGFGLPVVEAMACGAPVLTTDSIGVAPDLADAAWKIPPGNLGALAGALKYLLVNEDVRHALSERGLMQAQNFSWRAAAEATWRVYRGIMYNRESYAGRH